MLATCLAFAGVMLHVGGNFLNDWIDRSLDEDHRPERALPRGLFAPGLYLGLALCLMGVGAGLVWIVNSRSGLVAGGIVGWIVIYTAWHKRSAWAVVPMGLCRALTFANDPREGAVPLAAACVLVPPLAFISALLLKRLAPAT